MEMKPAREGTSDTGALRGHPGFEQLIGKQ
jgi:hypothetical protein